MGTARRCMLAKLFLTLQCHEQRVEHLVKNHPEGVQILTRVSELYYSIDASLAHLNSPTKDSRLASTFSLNVPFWHSHIVHRLPHHERVKGCVGTTIRFYQRVEGSWSFKVTDRIKLLALGVCPCLSFLKPRMCFSYRRHQEMYSTIYREDTTEQRSPHGSSLSFSFVSRYICHIHTVLLCSLVPRCPPL